MMSPDVPHRRVYYLVFVTLLLLTLVTVELAFFDLGLLNVYVALAIAAGKASLVVLFFMHARYRGGLTWAVLGAAGVWLAILLLLTLSDFVTRDWLAPAAPAGLEDTP